jgi:hypothetical protein
VTAGNPEVLETRLTPAPAETQNRKISNLRHQKGM